MAAVQAGLGRYGQMNRMSPYPIDKYTFYLYPCSILSHLRPLIGRPFSACVSETHSWDAGANPFSVPVYLAKTSRQYHISLLGKTAAELARCARGSLVIPPCSGL